MFDDGLIHDIIAATNALERRHDGHKWVKVTSHSVRQLVEVAFIASLEKEEGQPLRFALCLRQRASGMDQASENGVAPFRDPLPLSVASLKKIALAFDPKTCLLAVEPTSAAGELTIWGILIFHPSRDPYSTPHAVIGDYQWHRPKELTISAVGVGTLLFSRGYSLLGRFHAGQFTRVIATPLDGSSIEPHVLNLIETHALSREYASGYKECYFDILKELLRQIALRTHGATLVLVRDDSVEDAKHSYIAKYEFDERLGIEEWMMRNAADICQNICDINRDMTALLGTVTFHQLFSDRLQLLSRLASIDGALVLSASMNVLAFGATLQAPRWQGIVVDASQSTGDTVVPFRRQQLGTRHNSAIDFVGSCEGVLVFVLSHDGPLRCFARGPDNCIMCWPECSTFVF